MPDALSQDEVDALLNLVGNMTEETEAAAAAPAPSNQSTQAGPVQDIGPGVLGNFEQYNALPSHQINIYDFKRPERVSKSQVIALEALHEVFARNISASLSGYLRTMFEVRLISVEQFTYSEFTMSLPIPTSFNLLSCSPLEGHIILEVNPSILFPIIDRLLGGGENDALYLERPFTNIEVGLVNTVLSRIIDQLRETWESVREIDFSLYETESNPFLLQIVAPNEPIVLLSFEALMGDFSGMINVCIPFKVIEPIMPEFSQTNWFSSKGSKEGGQGKQKILQNIHNAPVELAGVMTELPLSLADILSLRVGDMIDTGHRVNRPLVLEIEGKRKFRAKAGSHRGQKCVELVSRILPEDPDA